MEVNFAVFGTLVVGPADAGIVVIEALVVDQREEPVSTFVSTASVLRLLALWLSEAQLYVCSSQTNNCYK